MNRRLFVSVVLALGLVVLPACGGGGGYGGPGSGGGDPADMTAEERAYAMRVLELVNEERALDGAPALAWDEGCARAAFSHAVDMDVRNYFDHFDPEGHGPGYRLDREGVDYDFAAENIAQGQPTPEAVMGSWMSSQGHRDNILDSSSSRTGVGVHIAPGGPWWVQVFVGP